MPDREAVGHLVPSLGRADQMTTGPLRGVCGLSPVVGVQRVSLTGTMLETSTARVVGPQSYAECLANLGALGHPENRDSHEKPYGRMVHHRITQGQRDFENSVGFLSGRARSASTLITRFIADHQGHRDSPDSRYGDGLMAFQDETADISSDGHARPAFPPRC